MGYVLLFGVVSFSFTIICITFTGDSPVSQYTLYFKENSPELSINKLGVMTTMRLDLKDLCWEASMAGGRFDGQGG